MYCRIQGTAQSPLGSPPVTRHPPFMINPSLTLLLHYHTSSQYSSSTLLAKDTLTCSILLGCSPVKRLPHLWFTSLWHSLFTLNLYIHYLPLDTVMEQLNCSWAPHQSQHDPPPFVITPFDTPSPHSFSVLISYPPTPGYCTGTAQLLPIGQKRSCPWCFSINFEYSCAYYCKFPQFF